MAGKIKDKRNLLRRPADGGIKDLEERLVRALADYQNLVKRIDREKHEVVIRANKNLLKDILPILDILGAAQEHLKDQGLAMALSQFNGVFEKYGVKEIDAKAGDKFDEHLHEVTEVTDGGETGTIAKVLKKGYRWQDGVVLRPAQVIVYNGISKKTEKELDRELRRGDYV